MLRNCGRGFVAALAAMALSVGVMAGEAVSPNAEAMVQTMSGGAASLYAPGVPDGAIRQYNTMTGELYANIMGTTVSAQRMFKNTLPSIADYSQSAHMVADSYCGPGNKWVMWDTPFLSRDMQKRDDGYLGYKQTTSGFATGISRMLGETTAIGLAVGYDARKLTGREDYHWRNKSDTFHAALYGGTAIGCFFVDGYAGYSRSWQRSERFVDFGGGINQNGTLNKGNYNDTVLSAGLKASYVWILPSDFRIIPAIGLDYSHVRLNGFTERDRGMGVFSGVSGVSALRVNSSSHDTLQMPITVAINKTFSANFLTFGGKCSLWTPEVRAGYVPQFGAKRASVDYAFENPGAFGSDSFNAKSSKFGGSYGTVGAGLKIKLKDKFIFAVDYDYTFGSKYDKHVVTGTYGVSF